MVPLSCKLSSATATFGRHRSFSSQISPDQGVQRISSSPRRRSSPRSSPRHVIIRRSQAEASHVVVRHFFNWPGRNARRHCQSKPAPPSSPARHCREGCDGATARKGAESVLMLVSQPIQVTQEEEPPSQTLESIESRVGDRGFWLQTGWDRRSQLQQGRQKSHLEWVYVGRGRRRMTRSNGRARGVGKGLKRKMVEQ
jgi:hypothetical protein